MTDATEALAFVHFHGQECDPECVLTKIPWGVLVPTAREQAGKEFDGVWLDEPGHSEYIGSDSRFRRAKPIEQAAEAADTTAASEVPSELPGTGGDREVVPTTETGLSAPEVGHPPNHQAAEAADREAADETGGADPVVSRAPSAAADLDVETLAAALGAYWSADPDYKRDPDLEHDYAEELAAAYAAAMKERP